MMIFSFTTMKRRFGCGTSIIMMTMLSMMDKALTYNMEARMYSLGATNHDKRKEQL